MERALKEIQELINCYDYWVRDCHPYFREPKEKFDTRKKELVETLKELRQSAKILNVETESEVSKCDRCDEEVKVEFYCKACYDIALTNPNI